MRTKTLLPISSRRGAARVSAVWMIVVIVLLLMALGYAYIAQDDASATERAANQADLAKAEAETRYDDRSREVFEISKVLGFTDDPAVAGSNVEVATSTLADLKAALPDMEGINTFQAAIPAATQAYQAKVAQIGELQKRIDELTAQVEAERTAKSELEDSKNELIAGLEQRLTDETDALRSELTRVETAGSELRTKLETRATEVTELEDAKAMTERALTEKEKESASQRIGYVRRLDDIRKRSEKADGEISAVLGQYDMGMINLAASDRLSEGIVFNIISGRPGADINTPKAKCVVRNVGTKFSEVEIFDVVDELGEPVVTGDKIYNSLYEPKGLRNAVFGGDMAGAYNKPELMALFGEIGINVQEELGNTTDFLIVGGPFFTDPETGEPLEEPRQPETLPVYAEAVDRGIKIVPVRDVLQYFRR